MYIYRERETDRQAETQTDRDTQTEAERQTETDSETVTERQRETQRERDRQTEREDVCRLFGVNFMYLYKLTRMPFESYQVQLFDYT